MKRLFCFSLIIVLSLVLVGCSTSSSTDNKIVGVWTSKKDITSELPNNIAGDDIAFCYVNSE